MLSATIAGNIGRDAETRQAGEGTVTTFSVASSRNGKDGQEVTTWVRCNLWGVRGEKLAQYLKKGGRVTAVGELEMRSYLKNGVEKFALEMRVQDVALQGGAQAGEGATQATPRTKPAAQSWKTQEPRAATQAGAASRFAKEEPDYQDEIPF
jgi:single-strand DNA-binding protein